MSTPPAQAQRIALLGLATAIVGLSLGALVALLARGAYLSLIMPATMGWATGLFAAKSRQKLQVSASAVGLRLTLLASCVAYVAYHLTAWLITDGASELSYGDYLAWSADAKTAEFSPLGLIARSGLGLDFTRVLMGIELAICTGASAFAYRMRNDTLELLALETPGVPVRRVREIIARSDEEGVMAAMQAIDAGDYCEAGRALGRPAPMACYALMLTYAPYHSADHVLEIATLDAHGPGLVKAARTLTSWQSQELWDELRLAQAKHLTDDD